MSRALVTATWSDAPHLSGQAKADLLASYLPHEIEARTLGIPSLGRGAVYPLSQAGYTCDPFPIPPHFPRAYGLDVGWNWTACVWWTWDRENDQDWIYREYQREQAPPDVHVAAIKSAGDWIPGCCDPAAKQRSQVDGRNLLSEYDALGLRMAMAMTDAGPPPPVTCDPVGQAGCSKPEDACYAFAGTSDMACLLAGTFSWFSPCSVHKACNAPTAPSLASTSFFRPATAAVCLPSTSRR